MTIERALELCDAQKPNAYSEDDKIHWLSKLDLLIWRNVISTHEGAPEEEFEGYTEDTDRDTELLADDTFADMYVKWLFAQIDFANAEIQRYNNSAMMFQSLYDEYEKDYNRRHMPVERAYIKGVRPCASYRR